MLESFLVEGRQDLGDGTDLVYGQSITDPCIDWETTVSVLEQFAAAVAGAARRMRIAVLGVGLIGGSIGLAAGAARGRGGWIRSRPGRPSPGRSRSARSTAARARRARPARAPRWSSAPRRWPASAELAAAALEACGPDAVVTDVGSTKRDIVAALGADERFIGGHPLAGAETSGVENARADLFEGARWYLTPKSERSSGVLYDRLQRTVAGLGARVQAIDAEAHDRLMATVSHLPHVVANVLVGQAAAELTRDSERMPEVGPSFRDTTRVAGANPAIWGDIFASNREAVAEAVEAVAARLRDAAELIRAGRARARSPSGTPAPPRIAAGCSRPSSPAGRCASCASSSPTGPARSPSWPWPSARPGSTSRTWRSTRPPT